MFDIAGFILECFFYLSEMDKKRSRADVFFVVLIVITFMVLLAFAIRYQPDAAPVTVPTVFR